MSEEVAMENYIAILSEAIPEWNVDENLRSKVKFNLHPLISHVHSIKIA